MSPPAVWYSAGQEMAYPLSSTTHTTGSCSVQIVFMNSQNSPSPVAPSPIDTYVTSSCSTCGGGAPRSGNRFDASALPAPCRHCMPVALDRFMMCSEGLLQCDGIMRPPEDGSSDEPTAERSISYGVMPSISVSARSR